MSNAGEHISKAAWTLAQGIKDALVGNINASAKLLKIEPSELVQLLALVGSSVDEGFHRGANVFDRVVAKAISDATVPAGKTSSRR